MEDTPNVEGGGNIEPSKSSVEMLTALNRNAKHVYGGTVSEKTKNFRRAKNRVARKSRRANRGKR